MVIFYVVPGLAYFIWRWIYYRSFLPLPFLIKANSSSLLGYNYVRGFVIFLFSNLAIFWGISLFSEKRLVVLINATLIVNFLFFIFINPLMGYSYRFVFPLLPLFLLLSAIGLSHFIDMFDSFSLHKINQISVKVFMLFCVVISLAFLNHPKGFPYF